MYVMTVTQDTSELFNIQPSGNPSSPFGKFTELREVFRFAFIPNSTNFFISIYINNLGTATFSKVTSVSVHPVQQLFIGDPVLFTSPYSSSDLQKIQYEMTPSFTKMYLVAEGKIPYQIDNISGMNIWAFEQIPFNTPQTTDDFDMLEQFPAALGFKDGRFILGNVTEGKNVLMMSKPGVYENFHLGNITAQLPDDSIFVTTSRQGAITWIKDNDQLFLGMDNSEHVISASGGVLATNDINIEQQSENGSSNIRAVIVEGQVAYIDYRKKKIRFAQYNDITKKWGSVDISLNSEHILKRGITEVTQTVGEYTVLVISLSDSTFATAVIENSTKFIGWSHHTTTGAVLSTYATRENGESIIYMIIDRPGTGYITLEKLYINNGTKYMDGTVVYFGDGTNTITHADLLFIEGQTVQLIVDGYIHRDVVVSGGSIVLDYDIGIGVGVQVGYKYIPRLVSLPANKEFQEGNDFMHVKTYSSIGVKLLNCYRPIINGIDTFERFPETPMGEPEPARTELVVIGNQDGWTEDALIDISQPLPLPLNIAAIGGKYTINRA